MAHEEHSEVLVADAQGRSTPIVFAIGTLGRRETLDVHAIRNHNRPHSEPGVCLQKGRLLCGSQHNDGSMNTGAVANGVAGQYEPM
jgi:hypothetical protein